MNKALNGFTLVEILIAMAITAIISIVIAQAFFATSRGNVKVEVRNTVKQGGDFAINLLEQQIRSSQDITSACASSGTVTDDLIIIKENGEQATIGCVYDEVSEVTRIASTAEDGTTIDYLTPANVSLGGSACTDAAMTLSFTCTSSPSLPRQVAVGFRLSQKGTPPDKFEQGSVTFNTTILVRN